MRRFAGACACLLLGTSAGLGLMSPAAGQDIKSGVIKVRRSVQSDPAVRSGVLPNGVRYFIQRAQFPEHGMSLRLGIDVGSLEEQDSERGFAHFVEHLAFRRTRSAPDDDIVAKFARLGVAFGRDQNAQTTANATTYRLDFNRQDGAGVEEGLRWLRDVADGIAFSDETIRTEHGVVIAEEVAGSDEARRINDTIARFQVPEVRSTYRKPYGLKRSLQANDGAALKLFYDRWYRPENAVVIIVGDRPVEDLEKLVQANFSTWVGKGPKPARAEVGKVNLARGLDAMTLESPSFPKVASACRFREPSSDKGDELSQLTREIRRSIWQGIVNERFKRTVNTGDSSLLGASVVGNENDVFSGACLIALPAGDDWHKALSATQLELIRFDKDGPTELEVETQVEEQRSLLRGAISNWEGRKAGAVAEKLLDRALRRRTNISALEAMHAFNVAVEDLDPAMVRNDFKTDWSGAGPLLSLTLPTKAERAKLLDSWAKTEKTAAIPAYTDEAEVSWPYDDFGKTGQLVGTEAVERPGFRRMRFANGVILNFKHLTTEPNTVGLRVDFGAGRRQIRNEDLPAAFFGSGMLISGGLGRLPAVDIQRKFRNVSWQFDFDVGNDFFAMSHSSVASNLPTMLQLVTAYLSDPGFRGDADARIPASIDLVFRNYAIDPQMALSQAMSAAIDPADPSRLPSPEELSRLRSSDFARVLREPITSEPIEVTIAGDIEEEVAVELVSKTLGALAPRAIVDRRLADTRFLRVPDRAISPIRATHEGPADKAAARLIWPLYVATPARRREEYALQLVAAVFNEGLRQRVRSELGKVYDPKVSTQMPDHADQGLLIADIAGEPADIDRLVEEARGLAAKLSSGAITADEVEAVRRPKLSAFAANRGRNSWWVSVMAGSARNPESIDELVEYEGLMSSVTLEEVKSAAAKWLSPAPIVGVALPKSVELAGDAFGKHKKTNGGNSGRTQR